MEMREKSEKRKERRADLTELALICTGLAAGSNEQ